MTLVALVAVSALAPGCTRKFFRERADKDVEGVVTQKNVFPDWRVQNWHVYPDPRARFADPSRPDRPPYPPDDYAARALSPNPQRPSKKVGTGRFEGTGYAEYLARWDAENRATEPGDTPPDPKAATPPAVTPPADAPREKLSPPRPLELPPLPKVSQLPAGPTVTEQRESGVVVVSGAIPDANAHVTPADVAIPVAPPPEVAPVGPQAVNQAQPPGPFPAVNTPGGAATPGATTANPEATAAGGDAATAYLQALASNEAGLRIKLDQAIELGLFNSREFQDRREDLYLAALPVTLQRFSFAAQGFFTEAAALDFAGRLSGRVPRNSAAFNTGGGFSKLFPTGALLLLQVANQVVVDLSGNRPTTAASNLSLSIVQPFLRGGGYAVTLEALTLAERNLLYAIRSYARFRRVFYVAIAAGGGYTNNPYGLQGLSVNLGRGIGGNLTAPSAGFLPLLLQSAIVSNQKRNIASLEQLLLLYRAFQEGGQQSDLQVGQVEQQLLGSRTQLLGTTAANTGGGNSTSSGVRGFLDTLDNFKLQLGLPLTTGLDLDQGPLNPIKDQLGRFEGLYAQARELEASARRFDPAAPVEQFRPRWRQLLTDSPLVRGTAFATDIRNRWDGWQRLTNDELARRTAEQSEERRRALDRRADRLVKGQPESEEETRRITALNADIDLGTFERAVRTYESRPWAGETGAARDTAQAAAFRDVFNAFFQLILEGRNERLAQIRRQWPKLPAPVVDGADLLALPIDDAYTVGIQTALTHRLDLMNARGGVVDTWRQIKVQANSLQGVFDVGYNLSADTPPGGSNPVAFSGDRTDHRLTFRAELPLVRRAERNNYRTALIGYQRQRRSLQAFEDNIANDVRADIREVRTIAELYRVQQRLIELGYSQVDNAQQVLLQPPAPNGQTDAGSQAALTLQVLQAQSSLLTAQNTLYTIYVNYLVSRMTLFLDLERMQLDDRGGWCDEPVSGLESPDRPAPQPARPAGERLPPPLPVAAPGRDR